MEVWDRGRGFGREDLGEELGGGRWRYGMGWEGMGKAGELASTAWLYWGGGEDFGGEALGGEGLGGGGFGIGGVGGLGKGG